MHKALIIGVVAFATLPSAFSQVPVQQHTVTTSQAGNASRTTVAKVSAVVTGIDKATRKIRLKRVDGSVVEVIAGSEVRNFDQIKVNDEVVVEYERSLSLTLQKQRSDEKDVQVDATAMRAGEGERPQAGMATRVSTIAEIVEADPAKRIIVLKGPQGGTIELEVHNPDHFKVARVGDQVRVVYQEAIAIAVQPSPAKSQSAN